MNKKKVISMSLLFAVIISAVLNSGCSLNDDTIKHASIQEGSIVWDGFERTYLIYIPHSYNEAQTKSLVIALHGGGGTSEDMVELTRGGFNRLADNEGFIVVYPDGTRFSESPKVRWNDGRHELYSNADDVGFISALIDYLIQTLNVNHDRIYITGISNGAHMAMRLARELSDKIAAVAPVAYSMQEKYASQAVSMKPISVLIMSGTDDPITPWEGGEVPDPYGIRMLGIILSVSATVDVFVSHNECSPTPTIIYEPDRDPNDGTRVRKEVYENCTSGTEVILYAIEGGGHTWPGGFQYLPEIYIGKTSQDIDANKVIWNFFKSHVRE